MAKARGAHSFNLQVRPALLSLPPAPLPSALLLPLFPLLLPAPLVPTPQPSPAPSAAAAGADPSVPVVRPIIAVASPAPTAGDAEGSSSMAPAQRRYHTRVGPTHLLLHILGQPGGPHRPRGPRIQTQGSHLHRDPGATLSTLSGYYQSPRPISRVHHQVTLLPLRPHPGECQL